MIRSLAVSAAVMSMAAVSLVACQPTGSETDENATGPVVRGDAMPPTYDWHFLAHGGTGELDFGDGDWAEGVSVFTLTCLPGSKSVEMSWGYEEEAVLTSGTATGTFRPDSSATTDHPVISALKASGTISVGLSQADMRLVGKDLGEAELAAFFDYCDNGRQPAPPVEAAVRMEANAAEIAAQSGEPAPAADTPAEAPADETAPAAETTSAPTN
ncbi:hypothetical protein ACETK8_04650 [Brevundimonas staleyi]|uniref:Lipoprotein n=1 Tax=Brevundimonas staleyi TaxID=74326 RepID=A0ABW0FY37_9CAUL